MVDKPDIESQLSTAWRSLGSRVSVAGGCLAALISLLHHVPVSIAALRGGSTWFALLVATRLGAVALAFAERFDAAAGEPEKKQSA
ncbi:MAG TPA: hypothetical protein ENJ09_14920 [Planctomycetes bacterium]|nr:hypothetical protein [Planctomycetota bacterium]